MICVDPFSTWCELIPLKGRANEEVWEVLYLNLFDRFGVLLKLRDDRGKDFIGLDSLKSKLYGV